MGFRYTAAPNNEYKDVEIYEKYEKTNNISTGSSNGI